MLFAPRPVGPPPQLLGLASLVLLIPALLAVRSRVRSGARELALCVAMGLPLALAAGAGVRAFEEAQGKNLELPWDAGLVAPYLGASLAAFGVVAGVQWVRRRAMLLE